MNVKLAYWRYAPYISGKVHIASSACEVKILRPHSCSVQCALERDVSCSGIRIQCHAARQCHRPGKCYIIICRGDVTSRGQCSGPGCPKRNSTDSINITRSGNCRSTAGINRNSSTGAGCGNGIVDVYRAAGIVSEAAIGGCYGAVLNNVTDGNDLN